MYIVGEIGKYILNDYYLDINLFLSY